MALLVVLKILQILGIAVLCVIGVALLLVLILLFVPIRYRVEAAGDGGGFRDVRARARVTWLFRLVRAELAYPEPGALRVKALWFTVLDTGKEDDEEGEESGTDTEEREATDKERRAETGESEAIAGDAEARPGKRRRRGKRAQEKTAPEQATSKMEVTGSGEETESGEDAKAEEEPGAGEEVGSDGENTASGRSKKQEEPEEKNPYPFWDFCAKIGPTRIWNRICSLRERIRLRWRLFRRNTDFYVRLLRADETRVLLRHLKKRLGILLKAIFPRRVHADLEFGFEGPDLTGYAYGAYCLVRKRFDKESVVIPSFEGELLRGTLLAKGRIYLVTIAYQGLRIWFDRRLRLLRKRLGRHREAMERAREKTAAALRELDEEEQRERNAG